MKRNATAGVEALSGLPALLTSTLVGSANKASSGFDRNDCAQGPTWVCCSCSCNSRAAMTMSLLVVLHGWSLEVEMIEFFMLGSCRSSNQSPWVVL